MAITENSHVNKLPAVKGRNYLFRVTDGVNEKPYEISAQDPQMLEDWMEMLNVVSDTWRTTRHIVTVFCLHCDWYFAVVVGI